MLLMVLRRSKALMFNKIVCESDNVFFFLLLGVSLYHEKNVRYIILWVSKHSIHQKKLKLEEWENWRNGYIGESLNGLNVIVCHLENYQVWSVVILISSRYKLHQGLN